MPQHYRLVASGRHDVNNDEIILSRDENGEVEHAISVHEGRPLSDEALGKARDVASRLGYRIIEAELPDDEEEKSPSGDSQNAELQSAGIDVVAAAPQIDSDIDQQSSTAPQQGMQSAEAQTVTADSGSSFTSETTNP